MTPSELKLLFEETIELFSRDKGASLSDNVTILDVDVRKNGRLRLHLDWGAFTKLFGGHSEATRMGGLWSVRRGRIVVMARENDSHGVMVPLSGASGTAETTKG